MLITSLNISSSLLSKAKVQTRTEAGRAAEDPMVMARTKFINAVQEQQALIDSTESGETYVSDTKRSFTDKETGEVKERAKRLRKWFWRSGDGYSCQLYYGNKIGLDQVFSFNTVQDLHEFLDGIMVEARNGVLDQMFQQFKGQRGKKSVLDVENPQPRNIKPSKNGR